MNFKKKKVLMQLENLWLAIIGGQGRIQYGGLGIQNKYKPSHFI